MKPNLLTKVAAATTMVFALSAPASSQAGDYVQESRGPLGILHFRTDIHTEPQVFYKNQRIRYTDKCGHCRIGIVRIPEVREVVTSRCTTVHIHHGCSPCATYVPRSCDPCYSTAPAQQPVITEPQTYSTQPRPEPRQESILAPVPETQRPTLAPQQPTLAPPRLPAVAPPISAPPKEEGPELIPPQEPSVKPLLPKKSTERRSIVPGRIAWN